MTLESGTRFGTYEVVEPVGAGGMGEVYRARDTSLKRDVALKVLPQAFVEDVDRLARFRREAEILAALNHPNIATIHGLEQTDDQIVIVMELVAGPTLEDRIKEGPLPPDEAMGIASQIGAALEAAHEKGIVHRDLKPANVKLRDDGTVKVLDFGISKPIDPAVISGGTPIAATPAATETGVILGTAAYMSPEQARGKFVDERTDIWAFGCLLFEMLTGQPAFSGEDVMLTLARVLSNDTNLDSIPGTISPAVRHTIRLCLEKDPRKRIADIRDVRLALDGTFESGQPHSVEARPAARPMRSIARTAAAVVAGAALTALVGWLLWPEPAPPLVTRSSYPLPPGQALRLPEAPRLAMAPDGRSFVYATTEGFYRREMSRLEAQPVPGPGNRAYLLFSSNSRQLIYAEGSPSLGRNGLGAATINRIPIEGGVPAPILAPETGSGSSAAPRGVARVSLTPSLTSLSLTPDESLLISHGGRGISLLAATGSAAPEPIIAAPPGASLSDAQLLPDGDTILFSIRIGSDYANARVLAQSISAGTAATPKEILPRAHDPRYLASGHLLFVRDGVVRAIAFDADSLETRGDSASVLPGVAVTNWGKADYDVSDDGVLVYITGPSLVGGEESIGLAWLDSDGRSDPLPIELPERALHARLSPDGRSLAVSGLTDDTREIFVFDDLERSSSPRLITRDSRLARQPVWTPDGEFLIYHNTVDVREGFYRRAADQSGPQQLLYEIPDDFSSVVPTWVHPDNDRLVFYKNDSNGPNRFGIYELPFEPGAEPEVLIDEPGVNEVWSSLSPDGQWLAYGSDESGRNEIYIVSYPDVTVEKTPPVSNGGGTEPIWDANGGRLFYMHPETLQIMAVDVQTNPELTVGEPRPVTQYQGTVWVDPPNYDYDPNRQRWLTRSLGQGTGDAYPDEVIIVQNWFEELNRLVPTD